MRLLQVGLGGFGRSWVEIVGVAPGIVLVGAVDPDPAARNRARVATGLPTEALFPTLADALAGPPFDAVLLATPPATHHPIGLAALAAGKHVLVEKPLATTLPDAQTLVAAAETAGRILMVSQNYRFRPPARAMHAVVASGAVGRLLSVKIAHRRNTRTLFGEGNFRYAMAHPLVIDMAIHHVDLLRMIAGREVVSLDARGWRVPDSPFAHDPAVAALMTLDGGASVRYDGDWATHDTETSWNGDWEILGEDGILRWTGDAANALTGEVTLRRWGGPAEPVAQPSLAFVDRVGTLDAFRRAVADGAEPETSGRDNLGSLAVVLAMAAAVNRAGMA